MYGYSFWLCVGIGIGIGVGSVVGVRICISICVGQNAVYNCYAITDVLNFNLWEKVGKYF